MKAAQRGEGIQLTSFLEGGKNPVDEIGLTKAEADASDHVSLLESKAAKLGVCQVRGRNTRKSQEDKYMADVSDTPDVFMKLTPQERKKVAEKTFAELQSEVKAIDAGSCALVSTGQLIKQENGKMKAVDSTSYVGDSVAFIIVLDKTTGKLKQVKPCNPELHDGTNYMERAAIDRGYGRHSGEIREGRLNGVLAVTRALGDASFDKSGISHIPQTVETEVELEEGEIAFKVLICDGGMEYLKGPGSVHRYAEELGQVVSEAYIASPEEPEKIAEKVVGHAVKQGSQDNITAMVVPITTKAVTSAIFDGHPGLDGKKGSEVSQKLSENYSQVFKRMVFSKITEEVTIKETKKIAEPTIDEVKRYAAQLFYEESSYIIKYQLGKAFSGAIADENFDRYKSKIKGLIEGYKYADEIYQSNDRAIKYWREDFLKAYKNLQEMAKELDLCTSFKEVRNRGSYSRFGVWTGALGGGGGGIAGGVFIGGIIGSLIFPGVGTAVGMVIGGIVGGLAGGAICAAIGGYIGKRVASWEHKNKKSAEPQSYPSSHEPPLSSVGAEEKIEKSGSITSQISALRAQMGLKEPSTTANLFTQQIASKDSHHDTTHFEDGLRKDNDSGEVNLHAETEAVVVTDVRGTNLKRLPPRKSNG